MNRREFIIALGSLVFSSCGGSGSNSSGSISFNSIPFGLGEDPAKLIDSQDPDARRVFDLLRPNFVEAWLNGAVDTNGNVYSPSMSYFEQWYNQGKFKTWSSLNVGFMIISWENYDGQNPALGGPTYGNYHISQQFLEDIKKLCTWLKDYKLPLYFVLAAEQSTYTACRYDKTCNNPLIYSDVINTTTEEYFSRLRDNLLSAINIIQSYHPSAYVGTCFGGWLVEFKRGQSFINYFKPVIEKSNAIFFQSMMGKKSEENNGYGNPQRILANLKYFSKFGKPVGLAYYMPHNKRTDVIADDMIQMSQQDYIKTLKKYKLLTFGFMEYGVLKDNLFDCLYKTSHFRELLR